jgi:RNA polymerase-associated protein CTR9
MDSDEEKEKKPKKARKPRSEAPSGDEGEPRKKRRGKLRKVTPEPGDEEGAIFTDEDDVERPAKKVGSV